MTGRTTATCGAFSAREAIAPDLTPTLSLDYPRDPQNWPDVHPRPVPDFDVAVCPPDLPARSLARALFFGLLALGKKLSQTVPDIDPDATINGAEGLAMIRGLFGHMFPHLGDEG